MRSQMVRKSTPEDEAERKSVRVALTALSPFYEFRGAMPLQYVTAFLLVAEEEGLGVGEYAKRANVSISVMSRHLQDIGDRNRHMDEGFGLVTSRSNPLNMREKEVLLTDKGRAVIHKLHRALALRGA